MSQTIKVQDKGNCFFFGPKSTFENYIGEYKNVPPIMTVHNVWQTEHYDVATNAMHHFSTPSLAFRHCLAHTSQMS